MCRLCGCSQYLKQGKEAVLRRAVEVVKELGLTAGNADDYEATEVISGLIAPFGSREDEVHGTAAWISDLHEGMPRSGRDERFQAHARAFRDIFARLPARGDPKHIATIYHQLEQLARELDEAALASLAPEAREAIQAVNQVHEGLGAKVARLKERYGL